MKGGLYYCSKWINSDLLDINPADPNLNLYYKRKVLAESMRNFW